MAIQIKHGFVSAKGDGSDATLVRPSNWNAVHNTSINTGSIVGRLTAGVGEFEEIPISPAGAAVIAAADASSYGFITGDLKFRLINTGIPAGWIGLFNTIGNAASSATNRANADVWPLWQVLYDGGAPDSTFPVSGGRTGNAANDFNAGKTMSLQNMHGKVFANTYGIFTMGQMVGEAAHTLTQQELPAVSYGLNGTPATITVSSTSTTVFLSNSGLTAINLAGQGPGNFYVANGPAFSSGITSTGSYTPAGNIGPLGSNFAHNNYQPTVAVIALVKL